MRSVSESRIVCPNFGYMIFFCFVFENSVRILNSEDHDFYARGKKGVFSGL
jgi:hypothetical protein